LQIYNAVIANSSEKGRFRSEPVVFRGAGKEKGAAENTLLPFHRGRENQIGVGRAPWQRFIRI